LPAHTPVILYNGTYKAPYTVKAQGNLVNYRPTVETMFRTGLSTETLARKSAINLVNEFNKWNLGGREVIPVGHGTQLQIPFPKPYVTPTVGVKDIPMPTLTPTVLGKYWGNKKMNDIFNMQSIGLRPIIPDGSVQTTLFKKGGKVKKVRKCENGTQGLYGNTLGVKNPFNKFSAYNPLAAYDPVTGQMSPFRASLEMNRSVEATKAELESMVQNFKTDPLGYNKYKPKFFQTEFSDIDISNSSKDGTIGTTNQFTQGVDKKTPYN
jgi:hypothetical protein